MTKSIAIASGKGGTGKTTVSIMLFDHLVRISEESVKLVDCDVEEPNDRLFFKDLDIISEEPVYKLVPKINKNRCTFCRKCAEYCEFNAIVIIPPAGFAEVNKDLCHSCGACTIACDEGAITEVKELIGNISDFKTPSGKELYEGRLKIGSTMQTMLIRELKKSIEKENSIVIYDAPPGTSCPVVETIEDTDYIILVTEPTPFGLHDLKLMVNLVNELGNHCGVIINKAGLGYEDVYRYLDRNKIEILGEIPFSKDFAGLYANGNIHNDIQEDITSSIRSISEKIFEKLKG